MDKKGFVGLIIWIIILFLVISAIIYTLSKPVSVDDGNSTNNSPDVIAEGISENMPNIAEIDSDHPSTG